MRPCKLFLFALAVALVAGAEAPAQIDEFPVYLSPAYRVTGHGSAGFAGETLHVDISLPFFDARVVAALSPADDWGLFDIDRMFVLVDEMHADPVRVHREYTIPPWLAHSLF